MIRHIKKPPKHDDRRVRKTFVIMPVAIDEETEAYLQFVYVVEKYDNNSKMWKSLKHFLTFVRAEKYSMGHEHDKTILARADKYHRGHI